LPPKPTIGPVRAAGGGVVPPPPDPGQVKVAIEPAGMV
jgi:hypothetical protein